MNDNKSFYILGINEDETRLFKGDQNSLQPVAIENMLPDGIEEAKKMSTDTENVQMRGGGNAFNTPIFRNEDMGTDHKLKELKRYFYHIDRGINEILGKSGTPLILAAPDQMVPLYKETSDYLSITPEHISGDFSDKDMDELHKDAMNILSD